MGIVFSNNGSTTLDGGIANNATSIVVTASASFPTVGSGAYFYATLIAQDGTREVVKCTALSSQTYTAVRAQDDTGVTPDVTGYAFSSGDRFQLRFPKIVLEEFRDDISNLDAQLAGTTVATTIPAPAGTNMYFYQAAAPPTWTIYTTVEDCLLAVKGGTEDYNVTAGDGAEKGALWTALFSHVHDMNSHTHEYPHTHGQASHVHTMPSHWHSLSAHTHNGPSHRHTISHTHNGTTNADGTQAAKDADGSSSNVYAHTSHYHTFTTGGSNSTYSGYEGSAESGSPSKDYTDTKNTGDTNSKDAGSTNSQSVDTSEGPSTADTEATVMPSTDRPLAAVGILATKDA